MTKYFFLACAVWTGIVIGMAALDRYQENLHTVELARVEARAIWDHNLTYRKWVADVGGVYVRTSKMPPNPYLKTPDRDKTTTDGTGLTLVNPAYMTRQVFERLRKESSDPIINRIVSDKRLNPVNKPDAWEAEGLRSFARGETEVSAVTEIEGKPYLRLLRPMVTTEGCLPCHEHQGYKVNDIRGGISVAVPMRPFYEQEASHRRQDMSLLAILWLLGGCAIGLFFIKIGGKQRLVEQNEALLHAVVDSSADAIFVKDLEGRYVLMNRAGAELTGKHPEDIIGRNDTALFPPNEAARVMEDDRNIIKSRSPVMYEHELTLANGRRMLQVLKGPVFDRQQMVTGVYGISRDITERKEMEDALRSSERRYKTITESATQGIMVADIESGRLLYANPEICRMLGYTAEELCTMTAADLPVEEERQASADMFRAHADGEVRTTERTVLRKDGSAVRMSITSATMEMDGRQCLVGFFSDITERRQLEEERVKSQKLEAIGTLAGGIAHDFNNLLQGVFGYISLAKLLRSDADKCSAALEEAEKALHHSVSLTSQLLTFAKGGKPVKKVIDLKRVIEGSVKFALSGSPTEYALSIDAGLSAVDVDEGQISQVIQNIVLNADQSMPLGGRIDVAAYNLPPSSGDRPPGAPAGPLVVVTVSDQGVGIPASYLSRVFDPYFTTKEKGSGLGLATSYSIVRNHGGSLTVSSEPGKGSVFTIVLPATEQGVEARPDGANVAAGSACRVLVMDDDDVVRTVAAEMLSVLGHEVALAVHGEEALAAYQKAQISGKPFAVVILDLTIRGGLGGVETFAKLKQIDPGVKAIVSSGYSDGVALSEYELQGFCGVLKKPYTIEGLSTALSKVLSR